MPSGRLSAMRWIKESTLPSPTTHASDWIGGIDKQVQNIIAASASHPPAACGAAAPHS